MRRTQVITQEHDWGRLLPGRVTSCANTLRREAVCVVLGQLGGPCGCSRVSGGAREQVRVRSGWGQVVQGHVGFRENSGFYPEGGGSPGGLWSKGGQNLTQVLTVAL